MLESLGILAPSGRYVSFVQKSEPFPVEELETVLPMNLTATGSVPGGSALTGIEKEISSQNAQRKASHHHWRRWNEGRAIQVTAQLKKKKKVSRRLIHRKEAD